MTTHTTLTTIAEFPKHYFLENLAVRADGSILVTALNQRELWLVPAPRDAMPVTPILVSALDDLPMGIVEAEPDIFYVNTLGQAKLERFDMRGWTQGAPAKQKRVLAFKPSDAGLNGSCLIGPDIILVADCAAGLIWRVDLTEHGTTAKARTWLKHETMEAGATLPRIPLVPSIDIPYPGVNGVRFASQTSFLYYTCSAGQLFARVAVDPVTHDAVGEPEVLARELGAVDDFCIDENAGVAYVGTHVDNSILRVPLRAAARDAPHDILVGSPFTEHLVGPSSLAWARGPNDYGRVAYVTTDGGEAKRPPDGVLRPGTLKRLAIGGAA